MILPTQEDMSVYSEWVVMYIVGDRMKSQKILDNNRRTLVKCAAYCHCVDLLKGIDNFSKKLYRGVLISPEIKKEDFSLWLYDHNSWTDNKDVAVAFSTNDSQYGIVFPNDYIGHIFEHDNKADERFCWFHYKWAKYVSKELDSLVKHWNQNEVILGSA